MTGDNDPRRAACRARRSSASHPALPEHSYRERDFYNVNPFAGDPRYAQAPALGRTQPEAATTENAASMGGGGKPPSVPGLPALRWLKDAEGDATVREAGGETVIIIVLTPLLHPY